MACPEQRVGPGWEAQFGVNHMGHYALTQRIDALVTEDSWCKGDQLELYCPQNQSYTLGGY